MNKELLFQIEKVKYLIKNNEEVKEYNRLSKAVKDNVFLKESEILLKNYQKEMVNLTDKQEEKEYLLVKEKYLKLKKQYNEYPLYINYLNAKEKINDLLIQISTILSDL